MTWSSIIMFAVASAGGWAIRHYYPGLFGVAPATPAAPDPTATPSTSSGLSDLLFQLLQGLIQAKTTSTGLPPAEAELAKLVHGLLTPLAQAPPPAVVVHPAPPATTP